MIRLIHLSDLHIGQNPSRIRTPWFKGQSETQVDSLFQLKKYAKFAKVINYSPPVDSVHCIVSGDLTATGKETELIIALTYLQGELRLTQATPSVGLKYQEENFSAVLGNHDIWGKRHPPILFSQKNKIIAQTYLQTEYPARWRISIEDSTITYIDTGRLRVRTYLLDSTYPGMSNVFARGRVPEQQLEKLKALVSQDAQYDQYNGVETCLRICVLHHPLKSVEKRRFIMLLENASIVRKFLKEQKFGLVLCGHEHICDVEELEEGMYQCVSGSATQTTSFGDSNYFLVYDITDGRHCSKQKDADRSCEVKVTKFSRRSVPRSEFRGDALKHLTPIVDILN